MKKLMILAAVAAMAFGAKAECNLYPSYVAPAKGDENPGDSVIQGGYYQAFFIQNAGADITAVANYVKGKTVAQITSEAKVAYDFAKGGSGYSGGQYYYSYFDASQDEGIDINPCQAYLVSFYGTPDATPTEFCVVANNPISAEDDVLNFDDEFNATSGWQTYGSSPEPEAKSSVTWSSDSRVEVNVLNKTTGSEVQNGDKVPVGSELEFTATAQGRWVYATEPEDWELDSNRTTITRTFTTEPQDLDVEIPLPTGYKIRYEWNKWDSEGQAVPPLTPNDLPEVFVKGTKITFDAKMVTDRRSDVEEVMITPEVLDDSNFLEYVHIYFRMREGEPVGEKSYIQVNDGKCTIFGEGEATELPNGFNRESIKSVTVTPGITKIGARFFKNCTNMKSVTLGKDVVDFGEKAFYKCFSLEVINVVNPAGLNALANAVNYRLMYNASGKFIMAPKINIRGYEEWLQGKENLTDATWTNIGPLIAQDLEKLKAANKYHFFRTVLRKQVD